MPKIEIKNLFNDMQNLMLAELKAQNNNIPHAVEKGTATEDTWLNWFKKYLPKRYTADNGFVIDNEGNLSDQIDIIIYDTQYSPYLFNQNETKYIPAESVYAVFEVKQDLTKEHIYYTADKIESVRKLKRTSVPIPHAGGTYDRKAFHSILGGLLTTKTDWKKVTNNIEKSLKGINIDKRIDLICCLNNSSFDIEYLEKKIIIKQNAKNEILIFTFLQLLLRLQKIGTAPAIDFLLYAQAIDSI